MYTQNERLEHINIEDEMQRAYIGYSMSVTIGRALPDARDGLKPVNRRILYAMREGGWFHNRAYIKCARVVGDVMGKYHPHGDLAVYDTLVRMAQDFSLRAMLIDGQGNFGSIDGDRPAAQRYTECRLSRLAEEMLSDIDRDTVDMRPNYDEKLVEPVVLPSRIPNLLANGSTGIAVGMTTNVPPHNLNELVDGIVHLIENPDATVADIMQFVPGPDFPTGGVIRGVSGIKSMHETGRGLIKLRGRAFIEEDRGDKERIIITEIPYALNKSSLVQKIAQLVRDKKLEGISDLRDESGKEGIRIVVEVKRGTSPKVLLNNIFKMTQLESTFGAIMLAIDGGRPRQMNLKEMMLCFVRHRYNVITRRARFDLAKAESRAHILEGLKIALDNLDDIVKAIRESKNRDEARTQLMKRFKLSEFQANAILELRLYQITGLERDKVEAEYLDVIKRINELKELLSSDEMIYAIVIEDLLAVKKQYGDERRTEIVPDEGDLNVEDLIADSSCVITISHTGYIKRLPVSTFRQQKRGGKGVVGMNTKEEDFVEHLFVASTHDYLLFFTEKGRIYWRKVYEVPEAGRTARGKAMINLLDVGQDDKVASLLRVRTFPETEHLVFATHKGVVKKSNLSAFSHPRVGGIIAISIDEDDRLVGVKMTHGDDEVMLVTRRGMSIRFHESRLRDQGRSTRGVRGITLGKKDDCVVTVEVVDTHATLLACTENGFGKRTSFDEYPSQNRGGKGVITIRTTERNGKVVGAHSVRDNDSLMLITEGGQTIRMPVGDLRTISRNTQGVRLINLGEGDRLISATPVESDEDDERETVVEGDATEAQENQEASEEEES